MTGMEITLRDVYDQQVRAAEQVAQLRTEVAAHTATVDERLANGSRRMSELGTRLDAHDIQIGVLNQDRQRRMGKADAITIIVSLAGSGLVTTIAGYLLTRH